MLLVVLAIIHVLLAIWVYGDIRKRGECIADSAVPLRAVSHDGERGSIRETSVPFYEVLCSVLDGQLLIFAKVRLADLVWIPKGTANRQAHFNRIQSKHVDFVLCDREKLSPVLVIELDDASHEQDGRWDRDAFLDAALAAAGLPVLHVPVKRSYVPAEVAALIQEKLAT